MRSADIIGNVFLFNVYKRLLFLSRFYVLKVFTLLKTFLHLWGFRLVLKSVTLNELERRNGRHFTRLYRRALSLQ